jgi:hypothetical protein
MFSEAEIKDKIQRIDDMTDKLWVQRELLPRINIKTLLKDMPVTFKNHPSSLADVMKELLSPSQQTPNANLVLTEAQKTTLKVEQEKEQQVIQTVINQINQINQRPPSEQAEQALIKLLDSHRKLLFSPVVDQNGSKSTLLEVAQKAYRKLLQEQKPAATTAADWKHHERKIQLPFRTAPPKPADNNTPSPAIKPPTTSHDH